MSRRRPTLLLVAVPLLLWAALTETGLLRHRALAGPHDTLWALLEGVGDGTLLADLAATALRLGFGVALGVIVGLPLGLFIGTSARRHRLLEPGMDFMRAVPPLLLFPLLLLALGYGDAARIAAVGYAAGLVISLYVSSGVRRADGAKTETLRAMGATRWQILRWVEVYEILPCCLTGLRHAVNAGLVVAVVTEMVVGAPQGLGTRAVSAQIAYDAPGLYAVILLTGACGYAIGSLLLALERRVVFWEYASEERDANVEPMMRFEFPTIRRRWLALATIAVLIALGGIGSHIVAMRPGPVPEPTEGPDRVVDRVRKLFPQTQGWFRIVATARFSTGSGGRIVPDYSTLTHDRVRWEDAAGHTIVAQFAPTFHNATRIMSGQDPDVWIDVIPEGGRDVTAQIQDGLVVYPDAYRDTDVLYKSTPTHTDEYLLLRSRDAPTRWTYRVRVGPGIERLRQAGTSIEAIDGRGVPWMRGNAPFAVDQNGTRVTGEIRVEGDRIIAEIDTSELELPILVDPDWRTTGDMGHGRFYFGVNVLPDGRVLATGGCESSRCSGDLDLPACPSIVSDAEALDLDTRNWSIVDTGSVRAFFGVAHSLPDGSVLVAGGCSTSDCSETTGLAEIYDVSMSAFRSVDPLPEPNAGHITADLPGGRVLVAGGCGESVCSARAHAFDPATGEWTRLADMDEGRARAAVAVLRDGRILVAGGCTSIRCEGVLGTAEIYDPVADTWDRVGDMSARRGGHYAVTLLDGRVLVGGGCEAQACPRILASAEIFDPRTGDFTTTGSQLFPRVGAVALRLPDGSVMVNQGCQTHSDCDLSNEVWDPASGEFSRVEDALTVRAFHGTVLHAARDTVVAVGGCQPSTCSWWNETYDVSDLMEPPDAGGPGPDAGPPPDAGPQRDAGPRRDAGPPPPNDAGPLPDAGRPPPPPPPDGCGCRVASEDPAAPGLALLALGLLLLRRRRA